MLTHAHTHTHTLTYISRLTQIEDKAAEAVQHNDEKLQHWQEEAAHFDDLARDSRRTEVEEGLRRDVLSGSVKADEEWYAQQKDIRTKHDSYDAEIHAVKLIIDKAAHAMRSCIV